MDFGGSNSASRTRLQTDLRRIDARLDELRRESDQLEAALLYLERRRGAVEDEWEATLAERDRLESRSWSERSATPPEPPPPPDLSGLTAPIKRDPALEPWELGDVQAPAPQWVPPARTWEIKIAVPTGAAPRRVVQDPAPSWVSPVETAPIWHRTGA